ncbi:hypothetical protein QNN98_09905 [Arthrobacter sp. zg-Y1143]|nr:hypothetical protein [Arthrobacter sp. zg-Y1143]MDK1327956.1 hypothetical protein [Arthrobacter sp. zg-Y1143]
MAVAIPARQMLVRGLVEGCSAFPVVRVGADVEEDAKPAVSCLELENISGETRALGLQTGYQVEFKVFGIDRGQKPDEEAAAQAGCEKQLDELDPR